jgi:MFS transporter, FSR family, fosmidomycin resistance protein
MSKNHSSNTNNIKYNIKSNLVAYGIAHAAVDATCAALVFSLLKYYLLTSQTFIGLVILYNLLAFGLQPIIGLGVDKWKIPKNIAIIGITITAFAIICIPFSHLTAIIIAGVGNALFHVGAGTISLNLTPRKATAPGIFVAPGALGLLVGTVLGKGGYLISWAFILTLAVLCVIIWHITIPKIDYKEQNIPNQFNYFELIIILILLAIVARALIGSVIVFPWKTNIILLIILTLAVVLGKALGGYLADIFGWTQVAVSALILSAPLLAFGANIPVLAIFGIFMFNMTMPVTLVAISNTLPGRPGFAFGLTTLALFCGTVPIFIGLKDFFNQSLIIFTLTILSAIIIYFGLRQYHNYYDTYDKNYYSKVPIRSNNK